jgi:hypothetical protein
MTTDAGQPEVPQDEIDAVQQSIDAEQTQDTGPQFATSEDIAAIRQLIQQQNSAVAAQVNGLASKVDTGLNAIRRDTTEAALERLNQMEQGLWETHLSRIEQAEDNAALAQEMRDYETQRTQLNQQRAGLTVQPGQPVEQAQAQAVEGSWDQVFRHVQTFGINHQDPRVDYTILVNNSYPESQRIQMFNQHLATLTVGAAATPTAAATTPVQPGPQGIVNPPREAGPAGARANFRSGDDIINAFNSDQIDKSQAVEQLRRVDPELLDSLGWGRR